MYERERTDTSGYQTRRAFSIVCLYVTLENDDSFNVRGAKSDEG